MRFDHLTPAREREQRFVDSHEGFDTEAKHLKNGFNFELSLKRDCFSREEPHYYDYSYGGLLAGELTQGRRVLEYGDDLYTPRRKPGHYRYEDGQQYHNLRHDRGGSESPRSGMGEDYRKRKRKNNLQLKILKSEFNKCDNWNKEKICHVAQITGLSESQVYKWCWDQKKKVEEQEN